jgi:hypothetical protein
VLGALAAGLVTTAPTASAAPGDGVAESSRNRYVLDEKAKTVRVKTEITVTNQQPSTATTYYFLTGHAIPIPAGAEKIRATSNGSKLTPSIEKVKGTGIEVASVSFPNLYYGKSRTITWTYELPGAPIRAKKNHIRIGEGYAVFPVIGVGDDDSVTVEVVLPKSMEFSSSAPGFKKRTTGGKTTWKATGGFIEGGVSARDPKAFDEQKIDVGDAEVSLQSFPGDKEWLDFADRQVTAGLPVLEKLIGSEWPGGLEAIREDVSSEALGYAWFDENAKEIVVSEDLDAVILYHEMTHAWINPRTVRGRWLSEGLTEVVAQRAAKQVGAKGQKYDRVKRDAKDSFALLKWDAAGRDVTAEVDAYGYPAAYTAVSAMVADLSDEEFTAVVNDAYEGRNAYDRPADRVIEGSTNWRTFLDLVQKYDTDASAEKALRTWVLPRAEAKELGARATARKTYAAVDRANGDWVPPEGLRSSMASWAFDDVATVTGLLDGANAGAAEVQAAAEAAGLPVSTAAKEAYESANLAAEYESLAASLPKAAKVTTQVGEAVDAVDGLQNPLTELGELVLLLDVGVASARADLDDGHLDDASATAAGVRTRADWAFGAGLAALVVLAGVAYAVFRVFWNPSARRRRAERKAFLTQAKETRRAGAPWESRQGPPQPPQPPQPPSSVGGELFGVQRGPHGPRGVQQLRRDDLGVQLEQRQELRRFLRDPSADQE